MLRPYLNARGPLKGHPSEHLDKFPKVTMSALLEIAVGGLVIVALWCVLVTSSARNHRDARIVLISRAERRERRSEVSAQLESDAGVRRKRIRKHVCFFFKFQRGHCQASRRRERAGCAVIPSASGGVPLLGHALAIATAHPQNISFPNAPFRKIFFSS